MRLARSYEQAGRGLWVDGDRKAAAEMLERAHGRFAASSADGDTRRVASLFSALGLRRPRTNRRATSGWDSLTLTEREAIDLVVGGHTNQAIADRLGVSRRTVETHLSHVYAKLGIHSRVELALAADRRTSQPT